jgi:hypothetical protein
MHNNTNIHTHTIPQHKRHPFIKALTTTTGITITSFITTTLSNRVTVDSLFRH